MAISQETLLEIYTNPHTLRIHIKTEVRKGRRRYKIGINRSREYKYRSLVESRRPLSILLRNVAISDIRMILEVAVKRSKPKTEGNNGADVLNQPRIDKIIELFEEDDSVSLVDTSEGMLMSI